MNRRKFLHVTLAGAAAAACQAKGDRQMNIVFMLMDDLGWHDVGPNGNQIIDTPNLDKFKTGSARFTNAYAACPVCSPTRASIMTGKYPARLHLTDWISGRKPWPYARLLTPPFELQLPLIEKTLAELAPPARLPQCGGREMASGRGGLCANGSGVRCKRGRRSGRKPEDVFRARDNAKPEARAKRIADGPAGLRGCAFHTGIERQIVLAV